MTDEQVLSAFTGWKRADLIFQDFYKVGPSALGKVDTTFMQQPFGIYLFLFHALLFSVLQFLKNNNSIPLSIATDVDSVYESLGRFRNAIYHLQDDYPSHKLFEFANLTDSKDKIKRIHSELGLFLTSSHDKRFAQ